MRWLDRVLTRRIDQPCYDAVPARSRRYLAIACRQLSEAEQAAAVRMQLGIQPRLVLVDEELAVMISPDLRDEIGRERGPSSEVE